MVLVKEQRCLKALIKVLQKELQIEKEEARKARVKLGETQKGLRMLNSGTNQLDHLLGVGDSQKGRDC